MATLSDNFNRANETPLAGNWTGFAGQTGNSARFNLSGNQVVVTGGGGSDNYAIWNADTFGANQWSEAACTISGTAGGGAGIGVLLRSDSGANATFYRVIVDHAATNNLEIARFNAGTYTSLKKVTQAWTDGDVLRAEISGYVISVYRNGTLVTTFDDTASGSKIASGSPGIAFSSIETSGSLDNWQGGDLSGPPVLQTAMGFVQAKPSTTSPTAIAAGLTASGATPKSIIIALSIASSASLTVGSLTDSAGNTYTLITEAHVAAVSSSLWYCNNPNQVLATTTFSLTHTGGATCKAYSMRAWEFDAAVENVPNTVSGIVGKSTTGSSTAPSIGSNTPVASNDILWIANHAMNQASTLTDTISTAANELMENGALTAVAYPSTTAVEGTTGGSAATNVNAKRAYRRDHGRSAARSFTGTLSATGSWAASIAGLRAVATGPATVDGVATLATTAVGFTVAGIREQLGAATLAATAVTLTAAGRREAQTSATLAATSATLTAAGARETQTSATLAATAVALTAAGVVEHYIPGAATLATTPVAISATAIREATGSATIATPVTLTAAGIAERLGAATLATTPVAIAAAGRREAQSAVTTITNPVTLAAAGRREAQTSSTLAATAISIATAGQREAAGAAALTAVVTLAATGIRERLGVASLALSPALSAAGVREAVSSAALAVGPVTIAATGSRTANAAATLATTPVTFTVAGSVDGQNAAILAIAPVTITVAGQRTANAAATLASPVTITATGAREKVGVATLPITVTLTAAGTVTRSGAATLPIAVTLAATGRREVNGSIVTIASPITLTVAGLVDGQNGAHLTVAVTLAATGIRERTGAATVAITPTIAATGTRIANARASLGVAVLILAAGVVENPVKQLHAKWAALELGAGQGAGRRRWHRPEPPQGATRY